MATQQNRIGKLSTDLGDDALLLVGLTAQERLSESYTVTVDAVAKTAQPLHTLLGKPVGVSFVGGPARVHVSRDFAGILWEYSELGRDNRGFHYRLVLRPAAEVMTLNRRNRIFQNESVVDIAKKVLVGSYSTKLEGSYDPVEYCVQYQESDFAFVSRLLEYEGIYYFYTHQGTDSTLVLIDNANAHPDQAPATVKVTGASERSPDAPVWSVTERRTLGPVKMTVQDYDFEAPKRNLTKEKAAPKPLGKPTGRDQQTGEAAGADWSGKAEVYDYPAKYTGSTVARGEKYGAVWLDAERRRMSRSFAEGAMFCAAVGRRLTIEFEDGSTTDYLIVATSHDYAASNYHSGGGDEVFTCSMELMPASEQYRPSRVTPRPRVLGPQTAVVTGPSGEEIYCDKYGRIKVQFFWDREGEQDENSSCYVRVMQSAAGKNWGSFALPRIGQEVVVEFLDGDPDRPLVTGAVYNAANMPPETLPDNKTQFGLKSYSTKAGGGYNRWWFEDSKGKEVVWFRAQRDYEAHIVDGNEKRDYDSGNRTTTFHTGDDTKTLKKGSLTTKIEKGDETRSVDLGKRTTTIYGNDTLEVSSGDRSATVKMGNDALDVSMGNIAVKAALGKITMEAMQSIELKVGGSSIKIDQIGVTIKGTVKVDIKGVMIDSSADAMHIVKGGLVMIN